ncbi:MaoC/PaaZ C-terminal domain-containing protein [Streptomyces sp. UNOB3_S3]|uniref:MaoC/PaaZ C-terminal domain-containing protein n=1 Tax=Streptomyces sp. UNOB3_S3 TaxID=2871682 RepID=UPI001E517322|nr:MaoC/PaaZ C-terminal domain-containing protein [Streptomyces sp. UNOB3_S3]MCC3778501.1 acyl dehydratase [Streptomyces sp. UNOB3_S3]
MKPGDELPVLGIPVTRTLIIAGALATRDFTDVHHDPEAARAKGAPDIFMNILTTQGLVSRFLAERLGPGARLRKLSIRLGVPNYPEDTLHMAGSITSVSEASEGERVVEVAITGTNSLGRHVTGTVVVNITSVASEEAGA